MTRPQRIVECLGVVQLINAVAVLRQRDQAALEAGSPWEGDDFLLIMDLAAPAGQEQSFVTALRQTAAVLHPWKSVLTLSRSEAQELQRASEAGRLIDHLAGTRFNEVREVYVLSEWRDGTQSLLRNFPQARKVACGESVGIYLSASFMSAEYRGMRAIGQRARALMSKSKTALVGLSRGGKLSCSRPAVPVDCYYLSIPDAFDPVPLGRVVRTDFKHLRACFEILRAQLPSSLLDRLERSAGGRPLVVLAGSNFSEQGALTVGDEIAAYGDFVRRQGFDRSSVLLLKPHPRDRLTKVHDLRAALADAFHEIIAIDDVDAFYSPLEVLLMELQQRGVCTSIDVCTFSSACLAAKYILGVQPRIGFGDDFVRSRWSPLTRGPRLRHEAQLRSACDV